LDAQGAAWVCDNPEDANDCHAAVARFIGGVTLDTGFQPPRFESFNEGGGTWQSQSIRTISRTGDTLYVRGTFTHADRNPQYKFLAALDARTGALRENWFVDPGSDNMNQTHMRLASSPVNNHVYIVDSTTYQDTHFHPVTGVDLCQGVTCTAQDDCHVAGACDKATGHCSNNAKSNDSACSDGSACTTSDVCLDGVCQAGAEVQCAAMDACHLAGTCDTQTGECSHPTKDNGVGCDDYNACTQADTCLDGVCTGASPVMCVAVDSCHQAGECDLTTGACSQPEIANCVLDAGVADAGIGGVDSGLPMDAAHTLMDGSGGGDGALVADAAGSSADAANVGVDAAGGADAAGIIADAGATEDGAAGDAAMATDSGSVAVDAARPVDSGRVDAGSTDAGAQQPMADAAVFAADAATAEQPSEEPASKCACQDSKGNSTPALALSVFVVLTRRWRVRRPCARHSSVSSSSKLDTIETDIALS
jgi:hypothetical protein